MKIGFAGYLWRYAFYFIVVTLAIYALLTLLDRFAPDWAAWFANSGGSTGLNVAILMLPGIYLGQKWARTEEQIMPRGFAWGLAACCTVIAAGLSAILAWWRMQSDVFLAQQWAELQQDTALLSGVIAIVAIFVLLVTRFAMWSAVRGELRRLDRIKG